ncbi:MAG: type II toxin-antitoxin system RelE/ParE family toxin [Methylovulum sp.]|nr:type II toxin-antitoxin system RelE/ParE family toxin [Methylovulum sp.]
MGLKINYKKPFSQFVKKQHRDLRAAIEDEIESICNDANIGELKIGDLAGIRVHKFKFHKQEYLIAYQNIENEIQFVVIDFYKIGTHENFYEELKNYIKASR